MEFALVRGVQIGLTALPLALALRVGEALAGIAYLVAVLHRRIGMTNLALAFPSWFLTRANRDEATTELVPAPKP
jgi:lauroyl/myristoyl acyltransferase